jgi:hypothetical protein
MFLPPSWALNATALPSFVPTAANPPSTANRSTTASRPSPANRPVEASSLNQPSASTEESLPEYTQTERNAPPAYPAEATPARPTRAHTRAPVSTSSQDVTVAVELSQQSTDVYVRSQHGAASDVEASISASHVRSRSMFANAYANPSRPEW